MRTIATIDGENINELNDGSLTFMAKAAIDTDGTGPFHADPDAQPTTSLRWNGDYLNADQDRYIVVPPAIIFGVKDIILGSQAHVMNTQNGMETDAVVGDIGPHSKLGEISVACAREIGVDPSPTTGGVEEHIIFYTIKPGIPALVGDRIYALQPS